jgi:hypothetical protein
VKQQVKITKPGAYVARGWVKSEAEQRVTCILENPDRPWAVYTYADIPLPQGQWVPIEIACAVDREGSLTLTLGGMSPEFCLYHGTKEEMSSPILVDDLELTRYEPKTPPRLSVWDTKQDLGGSPDWAAKNNWSAVEGQSHTFAGTPIVQGRHLVGSVRKSDGALAIYAVQDQTLQPRAVVTPFPAFKASSCTMVTSGDRTGIRVASENGGPAYTAWMMPTGVVRVEADKVPRFVVQECRMRYGLLPSFAGTDLCYEPAKMADVKQVSIPSTQWYVGLVEGDSSMLVAVWAFVRRTPRSLAPGGVARRLARGVRPDRLEASVPRAVDGPFLRDGGRPAYVPKAGHGLFFPHREHQNPDVGRVVRGLEPLPLLFRRPAHRLPLREDVHSQWPGLDLLFGAGGGGPLLAL